MFQNIQALEDYNNWTFWNISVSFLISGCLYQLRYHKIQDWLPKTALRDTFDALDLDKEAHLS